MMAKRDNGTERNRWKGFLLGVAGGAAGTLAMGYYWQAVTTLADTDPRKAKNTSGPHALDDIALTGPHYEPGEASTATVGRILYETLSGGPPGKETKELLSNQVHWSYGMLVGGVYGALRGGAGVPDLVGGMAHGTAVWLLGSELALPLLGLAPGPTTQPVSSHAYALGAHFAYGVAAALTTQILYEML